MQKTSDGQYIKRIVLAYQPENELLYQERENRLLELIYIALKRKRARLLKIENSVDK